MAQAPSFAVALLTESADAEPILAHAREQLNALGVRFVEATIGTRGRLAQTIAAFEEAGASVFIVADTTAASPLSAVVAASTAKPVLAVPIESPGVGPLEALKSSVTPGGPPVGTLAIGRAGAINAALLAVAILAHGDETLRERLDAFRAEQTANVPRNPLS
jgi:5-(carboxyamino)imidazole ribonucleotide mutase